MPAIISRSRNDPAALSNPNMSLSDRNWSVSCFAATGLDWQADRLVSREACGWLPPPEPIVKRECLTHHLVHVVIPVRRQPADERNIFFGVGEFLVGRVQRGVFRPWHRIIRI